MAEDPRGSDLWQCAVCTLVNHPNVAFCEVCHSPKHVGQHHLHQPPVVDVWSCPQCTYHGNNGTMKYCKACNYYRVARGHETSALKQQIAALAQEKDELAALHSRMTTQLQELQQSQQDVSQRLESENNALQDTRNRSHTADVDPVGWYWRDTGGRWKAFEAATCKEIDDGITEQWTKSNAGTLRIPLTTGAYFSKPQNRSTYVCMGELNEARTLIRNVYQLNHRTQFIRTMKREPPFVPPPSSSSSHAQSQQLAAMPSQCIFPIQECKSFAAVCRTLDNFDSFIKVTQCFDSDVEFFPFVYGVDNANENYDNVQLLNDFHHLQCYHGDDQQFEQIYGELNRVLYDGNGCDAKQCSMLHRNYRDRMQTTKQQLHSMYRSEDEQRCVCMQIIDRIHCHFLHAFDIGYRLCSKDRQQIVKDENSDIKQDEKHEEVDSDSDEQYLPMCNILKQKAESGVLPNKTSDHCKFVTHIIESKQEDIPEYDFGFKYYYYRAYKDSEDGVDAASGLQYLLLDLPAEMPTVGDWYIAPHFSDFKTELLHNCKLIDLAEFNTLEMLAREQRATTRGRNLKCARGDSAKLYEMEAGQAISAEQIMAVMAYCNFDALQYEFSKTYRRQHAHESMVSVKQRHARFYWLARRLREVVECIGIALSADSTSNSAFNMDKDVPLYHGVNKVCVFRSLHAFFNGPFSTSMGKEVAVSFTGNVGILLQLELSTLGATMKMNESASASSTVMGFDCQYFSDFNEREVLFIGGMHAIKIVNIIRNTTQFRKWILAIHRMTRNMSSATASSDLFEYIFYAGMGKQTRTGEHKLLSHEVHRHFPTDPKYRTYERCPPFVQQLLRAQCESIRAIQFFEGGLEWLNGPAQNALLRNAFGNIDFEIVMKVFPRVRYIGFVVIHCDINQWLERIMERIVAGLTLPNQVCILTTRPQYLKAVSFEKQHKKTFKEKNRSISIQHLSAQAMKNLGFDFSTNTRVRNLFREIQYFFGKTLDIDLENDWVNIQIDTAAVGLSSIF